MEVDLAHHPHSQWLQIALSEAEESRKAMLRILEEDGDLSATAPDDKKTLQVIEMIKDLNRRYCCLAHAHDLLRSKLLYAHGLGSSSSPPSSSSSSSSDDKKLVCTTDNRTATISTASHFDTSFNLAGFDGSIPKLGDDLTSDQPNGEDIDQITAVDDGPTKSSVEVLRVSELMQENMRLQIELARRNDEKREAIKGLQIEVERLKIEKRSLEICLRSSKISLRRNRSQISRLAGPVLSKFFGRGSP